MATVFLQLLLHGGKQRGLNKRGHRNVNPVGGRYIIVRYGPTWLQRAVSLGPQLRTQ
jgi:hypothetical protein